ncbi:MAG TPA: arylamine N-acetyltransferase [Casimicrobiaceae bacterium]|nr:arylamine N-acetyltransferase [Casimicrobiaceae bacterium]
MQDRFDIDAYLERIQWGGSTAHRYDTVAGLLRAHIEHIPFENLDVLLGRGVRLDAQSLQDKLVRARRGGYCFEHASLLAAALEALGFAPAPHTARVVMVVPKEQSPRTHMFLTIVLAEGTFVLDPGFGRTAPRVPVPLQEGAEACAENEVHWMAREGGLWMLRTRDGDRVVDCWVSEVAPDNAVDFEMGNHFVSTYPSSPFVNRLMLRAYTPAGQVTVMDRDVTQRTGSQARTSVLTDRNALRALVRRDFGFDLPEVESMRVPSIPEWD